MMTITATTCAYHDTIGGACSRESNTLRYGHHTAPPARLRRQLPRRRDAPRADQARPRLEHQLVHERAGRRRRHARHRRRHLRARACRVDLRAEMDVLVLISNCPQINNPCNGFDPTPVRVVVHRRAADAMTPGRAPGRRSSRWSTAGPFTTVQDLPGRVGYWHVGVPPNGPMDDLAHRLANRVVGNAARRRGPGAHRRRPDAALHGRRRSSPLGGAPMPLTRRRPRGAAVDAGRRAAPARRVGDRRDARARAAGHAGGARRLRRPRRSSAAARRSRSAASAATTAGRSLAGDVLPIGDDVAGPAGAAAAGHGPAPGTRSGSIGVLVGPHSTRRVPHRPTASPPCCAADVGGALQLGAHRRAADRPDARGGRGPTAATPACTRRTSTTPATRSARSTSPATCR